MSHFTKVQTQLREMRQLQEALHDLGIKDVQFHAEPATVRGYNGQTRVANLIATRESVAAARGCNMFADIGFLRDGDGNCEIVIDDYDLRALGGERFIDQLTQRYARNVAIAQVEHLGYEWDEQETDAGIEIQVHVGGVTGYLR